MELPRSISLVPRLSVLDEVGSTNDVLAEELLTGSVPAFTTIVSTNQTGGRGRLGRTWVAPAGKCLAVSVLLRPRLSGGEPLGFEHFGWLPLIAGAALCRTIDELVGGFRTRLKWPNDVQVDGRKISGILAELQPSGDSVILGTGINVTLEESELPVATATSLLLAGVDPTTDLIDRLLSGYLSELQRLLAAFLQVGGDAGASGIFDAVTDACSTLGQEVRVELPGGATLRGVATHLDPAGRLVVRQGSDGSEQAVAAGDVTHLRYE